MAHVDSFVSLLLILASLCTTFGLESIKCRNGINKGDWGSASFFSGNTFARGIEIKHDGHTSNNDNTRTFDDNEGQTGCRIFGDGDSVGITSDFSKEGDWQFIYLCPNNGHIIGLDCNVNPNRIDQLGVENIKVLCIDSTLSTSYIDGLHGNLPFFLYSDRKNEVKASHNNREDDTTLNDANWGGLVLCTANTYVCGLQTRIASSALFADNMGLTDLEFFCC